MKRARSLAPSPISLQPNLSSGGVVGQGFLGVSDERSEGCGVVHREIGQDLAVQLHSRGLEAVNELRVADAVHLGGGVDAHDPQRAVLPLLLLAAAVGELQSALDGFLRRLVELGFCEEVTAGALQDLFAAVIAFCSTFY